MATVMLGKSEYYPRNPRHFTPFHPTALGALTKSTLIPPMCVTIDMIITVIAGSVPQIFAVAEQHPSQHSLFRLGFFQRLAIGTFDPPTPPSTCERLHLSK